jgi:hypothetical protein
MPVKTRFAGDDKLFLPEIVVLKNGAATFGEKVAASAFGANISEKAAAARRVRLSFAHP